LFRLRGGVVEPRFPSVGEFAAAFDLVLGGVLGAAED
jgi:hypothetical protein